MKMRNQVVTVVVVLCFTRVAVDANAAVEAVLEQLKSLVQDFVPDKAKAQEYIAKIDTARECLSIAKGINPDVIKQFADGIIPTVMECGGKHMGIADAAEKEAAMKGCFQEKANKFKESSGMSPDDIKMFDATGVNNGVKHCITQTTAAGSGGGAQTLTPKKYARVLASKKKCKYEFGRPRSCGAR